MLQMSRNIFTAKHDSQKDYRGWACFTPSVELDGPLARGGIELRDIDE